MDIPLLEKAGISLFGNQWQSDMARELEVSPRTVRHWAQTGHIPAAKWKRIFQLCASRREGLWQTQVQIAQSLGVHDMDHLYLD